MTHLKKSTYKRFESYSLRKKSFLRETATQSSVKYGMYKTSEDLCSSEFIDRYF